jgi:hypothetical protein
MSQASRRQGLRDDDMAPYELFIVDMCVFFTVFAGAGALSFGVVGLCFFYFCSLSFGVTGSSAFSIGSRLYSITSNISISVLRAYTCRRISLSTSVLLDLIKVTNGLAR